MYMIVSHLDQSGVFLALYVQVHRMFKSIGELKNFVL